MSYQTTITRKGQITIPKPLRDTLELNRFRKIIVELGQDAKDIKIRPADDFLKIAQKIKVIKKTDPIKARQQLEKSYERS